MYDIIVKKLTYTWRYVIWLLSCSKNMALSLGRKTMYGRIYRENFLYIYTNIEHGNAF